MLGNRHLVTPAIVPPQSLPPSPQPRLQMRGRPSPGATAPTMETNERQPLQLGRAVCAPTSRAKMPRARLPSQVNRRHRHLDLGTPLLPRKFSSLLETLPIPVAARRTILSSGMTSPPPVTQDRRESGP